MRQYCRVKAKATPETVRVFPEAELNPDGETSAEAWGTGSAAGGTGETYPACVQLMDKASQDFTHQSRPPHHPPPPGMCPSNWLDCTSQFARASEEAIVSSDIINHYRGNELHDVFPTLGQTNQIVNYILFHLQRDLGARR